MAIRKRQLCYFFVYTQKGYHLETVRFNDATYWHRLEENLTWFYSNCLSRSAITASYGVPGSSFLLGTGII